MASQPSSSVSMRSKIPRYVKTKVPVSSLEYRKTLRAVKEKRTVIVGKETAVKIMKKALESVAHSTSTSKSSPDEHAAERVELEAVESQPTSSIHPGYNTGSSLRSVIVTPGGTKRKVKPSYRVFMEKLENTLGEIVRESPGKELMVEELISRLEEEIQGVRVLPRKTLLRSIVDTLKTTVKRKGRRKELYYADLSLVPVEEHWPTVQQGDALPCIGESSKSPCQKSPLHKQPRISVNEQESRCRGRLDFSGLQEMSYDNEHSMGDLAMQIDDLELSSPDQRLEDQGLSAKYEKLNSNFKITEMQVQELSTKVQCLEKDKVDLQNSISKLEESFADYELKANCIIMTQEEVIQLYKEILDTGEHLGGLLSLSERETIKAEIKKTKSIFNLGLRTHEVVDLADKINPLIFGNIVEKLRKDCPMITNILEQLVLTENTRRNSKKTTFMKMKASVHLLASLVDVRDQRSGNDIPVLFGMLCLCYGAGPSLIKILQHLGLSESFQVLIAILKRQLANYKTIITQRVADDAPIITYNDNMQMMRTSLRHLRLNKLQKDKVKQNKMWDFTVRGWRVAEISGIEHLFLDETSATKPQRDLKTLKYEDTKIECNQEHLLKWNRFKKRNILRKMDLSLNAVEMTSTNLLCASSESLQKQAEQKPKKNFNIIVLPPDEEFPELGTKESKMYPLPISHENQCTNLGVASNLELFSEEFGFNVKKGERNLTLKRDGKEFNLQHAYDRYAFMKSLEKHKAKQMEYEQILRGQEVGLLWGPMSPRWGAILGVLRRH